ncbi:hypothetical protein AaE_011206, partial [Aphanomyces astaci]
MPGPLRRGRYSLEELQQAVQHVVDGENGRTVSKQSRIPYSTLMKAVLRDKAGIITQAKRRGPPTALPKSCEDDIVAWVCGMQHEGHPVDRHTIMVKATQVYRRLVPHATLSDGWYQRFMARHSQLTNRVAQVISHARNNVDEAGIERLHQSLTDVIAEHGITADRVFNMDETSFASRRKSKDV